MELKVWSKTLGEPVRLVATRPRVRAEHIPVVWLLHGRDAGYSDVRQTVASLGAAMDSGALSPHTIVAPWSPWLHGAGWWVDSEPPAGRPLESVILGEVLPQVEDDWGLAPDGDLRIVAGYSMGGGAAVRWLLTHGDLFGSAALVAPAAYALAPPIESSARSSGAFGLGAEPFDLATWERVMSYRTLLLERPKPLTEPVPVAIVVGDLEPIHSYPDERSSLTVQAARLHAALIDAGFGSALRVVAGGHTEDFWAPALVTALGLLAYGPRGSKRPSR